MKGTSYGRFQHDPSMLIFFNVETAKREGEATSATSKGATLLIKRVMILSQLCFTKKSLAVFQERKEVDTPEGVPEILIVFVQKHPTLGFSFPCFPELRPQGHKPTVKTSPAD